MGSRPPSGHKPVGPVAVIDWSRDGLVDRKRRRVGGAGMNRNDPAHAEEDALDV
jgi:hypothetical protein